MSADADFVAYVLELFAPGGRASARRMFGGYGIHVDGAFCAIAFDGRLYLKTDAETQAVFAAAGCGPFVYTGQEEPIEMGYWSVPEEALDSAEAMGPWLRRALEAAGRRSAGKKPRRR